jgi:hypothetical protein
MDMKISDCQTIAELNALENMYVLSEAEQRLVYAKKVEIIGRLLEWGIENEQQGLTANLFDSWTSEQRQQFMFDWNDDEPLQQLMATEDFTQHWSPEERESFLLDWNDDEPLLQMGCGEKRSFEDDGAETSTAENNFTVTNVKQVKMKKFGTTGTDYMVQFTDMFTHLELCMYLSFRKKQVDEDAGGGV